MQNKSAESSKVRQVLKALSSNDFRSFGLRQIAYIRPAIADGSLYYQICSAEGEELMTVESLELAKVLARQEDLEPMIVQ